MASRPTFAKLSRPKVRGLLARERLFTLLDAQRERPALWIAAPPGAGKTSLVASYLQVRKLAGIWYQVDSGDADPASFFYYLSLAAPPAARAHSLPLLTPEYVADLPAFTRRFFRALFERMPARAVLVLDNCHEVNVDAPLHSIVRDALNETRAGLNLILLSRSDPPAPLARAQANGLLGRVGWDELRLTADETRAIALADHDVDAATADLLQQQSGGWAAGLVLMLQRLKYTRAARATQLPETMEAVFDYFAGEVFDRVPAATRDLLLRTAFLPRVTEQAAHALTSHPDAGALLERLYRQRLFTDRHSGEHTSYQYHALFSAFLRNRVAAAFPLPEQRRLKTLSARLLEDGSDVGVALALHAENDDWDAAIALILKRARGLIVGGRWLTLKSWIALLPKERVAQAPWLTLWLGSALILIDPPKARALLTRAYERLLADGDELGQVLAATGIIESHNIDFASFEELDAWIEILERLLQRNLPFRAPTERLRVLNALMLATLMRRPAHPMISTCLTQARASLAGDLPIAARADTATQLLQYFTFTGDLRSARSLVAQVAPLLDSEELSPFRRAGWLVFFSYYAIKIGAIREGLAALDHLRGIAQEYGMTWFSFYDLFFRALLHLLGPHPMTASSLLSQLSTCVEGAKPANVAKYHLTRVLLYQATGEASLAIYHGELCLDACRQSGGVVFEVLFTTVVASAFVEAGQTDRALSIVAQARAIAGDSAYRHHEALMLMVESYAYLSRGDAIRARTHLARAFARGNQDDTSSSFRWLVSGLRRMLASALRDETQAEQARALIAQFGIAAESPEVEPWPWAIRIQTLGAFALLIDGAPPPSQRKVQKKPLEMLKYLVAQGGREVSATALIAALWPDAEGDAAQEAFEVTLRRLRKLLDHDDVIALNDAKLTLNAGFCWLDTWAFERTQVRVEALLANGAGDSSLPALADRALALYAGHFLAGEDEQPWLLAHRQRLASKFLRLVSTLGQHWENQDQSDKAELVYRRALELEPLAEALYRRLMALQAQLGSRAEALDTYRRCRQMLSAVLASEPSKETETLYRAVLART